LSPSAIAASLVSKEWVCAEAGESSVPRANRENSTVKNQDEIKFLPVPLLRSK